MFRNVRFFRIDIAWPDSEQSLSEQLASAAFTPCGPWSERSAGFEPPTGDPDGLLARRIEGADLLRLRSQARLLPAAAIDDALEVRLEEWRQRMQAEPSSRERRKLKAQTRDELLPKALLKSQRTRGFVIASERLLAVDTLSDARTEQFLEHLRAALGTFDAVPLTYERPFADLLTRIFLGDPPRGFVLGRECRMCDASDTKASIRCADMDLADPAVRRHVREGMRLTHLEIEFENVMRCTIDEKGGIAKLKLVGSEVADDLADEDPLARLDAEFALLTGTLRQLVNALKQVLGGYEEEPMPIERLAVGA
ncbi:MAG TPA: recombination-associated protein RdgC [Woeseiaceae bacterium]|nr:recombination-associated protein RdgC [Woeseiaceae bacterium]